MKSWPATFALIVLFGSIGGAIIGLFELGSFAALLIGLVAMALVVVVSKRPEYRGLRPPPAS